MSDMPPLPPMPPIALIMHTTEPASMASITPNGFHEDDYDGLPWLANVYHHPASSAGIDVPEHWVWELIPPDGSPLTGVAMTDPAPLLDDVVQRAWAGTPH